MTLLALVVLAVCAALLVRSLRVMAYSTSTQRAADRLAYRDFRRDLTARGVRGRVAREARTAWLREHMSVAAYRRRRDSTRHP